MYFQIVGISILVFVIIAIILWFIYQNRLIAHSHRAAISFIENAILTNRSQINFRIHYLNNYDLLQYNLRDALIIQTEIEV